MRKTKKQKSSFLELNSNQKAYYIFSSLMIIVFGVLAYSNIFSNSFNFDDNFWLNEPAIRNFDLFGMFGINKLRIIPFVTLAFNYKWGALDTSGYFLFNLSLHIINALLVWQLILITFKTPGAKDLPISKYKNVIALFAALIFLLHPMQTQAVSYIYQRLASIAGFFYFSTILLYAKARLLEKGRKRLLILSFFTMIAAFFSKENTFTLPFAIIAYEIFFFKKDLKLSKKHYILASIIIIIPIVLFFSLDLAKKVVREYTAYTGETIDNFTYFYTQLQVIPTYIKMLFVPMGQSVDHDYPVVKSFFNIYSILGAGFIATLLGYAVYIFNKNRLLSFAIVWFFLTIAVESSFIPILDTMVEHRVYIPLMGFAIILPSIAYSLLKNKKIASISFIFVFAVLSILTFNRNKVWENQFTLWSDAIEKAPEKARPYNGRGLAYFESGNYKAAYNDYTKAIQLTPSFELAYQNRGNAAIYLGKFDQAINDFTFCLDKNPWKKENHNNRANAYLKMGEFEKAAQDYDKFIKAYPKVYQAFINRAVCFEKMGETNKAIEAYQEAIELNPTKEIAYTSIANIFNQQKEYEMSLEYYDMALEAAPSNYIIYINRATTYYQTKNYEKAIEDYQKALNINPKAVINYKYIAMCYHNMNKYQEAAQVYTKAIQFMPKDYQLWYNRGNMLLYLKQYQQAYNDFAKAVELNPNFRDARIQMQKLKTSSR